MCCHHLLDCKIFSSWISFFIQKGIVIIRRNLWQVQSSSSRATIHETKVCTTVEHVKIDGALFQNFSNCICQFLRIPCDNRFFPTIKPTIPELHTHEWPFLPMFIKEFLHLRKVVRCLRTKVSCYKEVLFN
ncbi:Uncharacterised protein [Streptococcus pneumoniae]|nr:Uncharacterised protein [Streptococcus pneumoniae]